MDKRKIQLRGISNVGASKTALITMPIDEFERCHYVQLQHGYASGTNTVAATMTNITEIRHIINGTVIRKQSGTQLRDWNILNGTTYDCTGVPNTSPGVNIPIFFAEPWRKDPRDQDALAWSMKPVTSWNIEVDFGAASTPTLLASAIVDDFIPSVNPKYVKILPQPFNAGGTSFDISTIEPRGYLQQVSFYPDSGGSNAASKLTVRKLGKIIHELTSSQNLALLNQFAMTPSASGRTGSMYDWVIDHDDLLGSAILLNSAITCTLEAASAMSGTVTAVVARYEKLDNTVD